MAHFLSSLFFLRKARPGPSLKPSDNTAQPGPGEPSVSTACTQTHGRDPWSARLARFPVRHETGGRSPSRGLDVERGTSVGPAPWMPGRVPRSGVKPCTPASWSGARVLVRRLRPGPGQSCNHFGPASSVAASTPQVRPRDDNRREQCMGSAKFGAACLSLAPREALHFGPAPSVAASTSPLRSRALTGESAGELLGVSLQAQRRPLWSSSKMKPCAPFRHLGKLSSGREQRASAPCDDPLPGRRLPLHGGSPRPSPASHASVRSSRHAGSSARWDEVFRLFLISAAVTRTKLSGSVHLSPRNGAPGAACPGQFCHVPNLASESACD